METGYIALNIFVVVALVFIFLPPLLRRLKREKVTLKEFFTKPRFSYGIYYIFIFSVLSIFYVILFNSKFTSTPDEELAHLKNEELYDLNYYQYYRKLIDNKYDYKALYLLYQNKEKAGSSARVGDFTTLLYGKIDISSYDFEQLSENAKNSRDKDLGYVGNAIYKLIYYHKPAEAFEILQNVEDKKKPFLHTLLALSAPDSIAASDFLETELKLNGPIDITIEKLSKIYYNEDISKFKILYDNPNYLPFIPISYKEDFAFTNFYLLDYFVFETQRMFNGTTTYIVFAALLILFLWLYFLLSVDVFEKEKLIYILSTLGFSFLLMYLCSYLYDALHYFGVIDYVLTNLGSFGYYVFIVGFVEETIKVLPFLIILRFTKILNEPIDYILYGALGALMFSVAEDFIYFNNHSIGTIYSRAIFTSLGHIGLTSIITYSFVLTKYYYKKNKVFLNLAAFLGAAALHGTYDFLITADWGLSHVSGIVILCFEIWLLTHYISNCLSNSMHFKKHLVLNTKNLGIVVSGGLLITIVFTYVHAAKYIDPHYATGNLFIALIWYAYPIFFIKTCINRIDIVEGEWSKFSVKPMLNPKFFFAGINHCYWELVEKQLFLQSYGNHTRYLKSSLPQKCTVISRVKIDAYSGWFYVKLNSPITYKGLFMDYFLIRTKDNYEPISNEARTLIGVYFSKNKDIKNMNELGKNDIVFIDWAFATLLDSPI